MVRGGPPSPGRRSAGRHRPRRQSKPADRQSRSTTSCCPRRDDDARAQRGDGRAAGCRSGVSWRGLLGDRWLLRRILRHRGWDCRPPRPNPRAATTRRPWRFLAACSRPDLRSPAERLAVRPYDPKSGLTGNDPTEAVTGLRLDVLGDRSIVPARPAVRRCAAAGRDLGAGRSDLAAPDGSRSAGSWRTRLSRSRTPRPTRWRESSGPTVGGWNRHAVVVGGASGLRWLPCRRRAAA